MKYLPIDEMWNELTPEQWNELKPWEILMCEALYRMRDWEEFKDKAGFENRSTIDAALAAIDPELLERVAAAYKQLSQITKHEYSPENMEFKAWAITQKHLLFPKG